jgi:oligoendopeptidase F
LRYNGFRTFVQKSEGAFAMVSAPPKTSVPPRSQVSDAHKWNKESVFASREAWAAELKAVNAALPELAPFQGTLSQSASRLADWFEKVEKITRRASNLFFYAAMSQAVETTDQDAISMRGQAGAMLSQLGAAASFSTPEMLAIGESVIKGWVKSEPRLATFEHFFHDLFRQQQHVRSGEVEEVLALAAEPFGAVDNTEEMLTSADMKFAPVKTAKGETIPLAQSNISTFLDSDNRDERRQAWENYADG